MIHLKHLPGKTKQNITLQIKNQTNNATWNVHSARHPGTHEAVHQPLLRHDSNSIKEHDFMKYALEKWQGIAYLPSELAIYFKTGLIHPSYFSMGSGNSQWKRQTLSVLKTFFTFCGQYPIQETRGRRTVIASLPPVPAAPPLDPQACTGFRFGHTRGWSTRAKGTLPRLPFHS